MTRNFVAVLTAVGFVGITGCAAKVAVPVPVVAVPAPPPVIVADVPPPPPPPKMHAVCDAEIRPDGHLKFPHEVEFEIGKANLKSTDTTNKILQCLVDFLNENKMVNKFRLEGYTDSDGDAAMNTTLSDARANAVVAWMTSHGIEGGKIWAKGYGPKKPVAANDTPEHKAMNRRVEFHIDEINGVHVSPERVGLAMNPPIPVATTTAVVGVAVPGVAVAVPGVAVGVPAVGVAVPTVGVGVAAPTVGVVATVPTVGVGIGGTAAAGGGGKPKKPEEKKPEEKK
jgi:OOP family OmpA-OmpF porin